MGAVYSERGKYGSKRGLCKPTPVTAQGGTCLLDVYELRKRFDGPTGIYPEPNAAAFAAAEEFKDIMIRSGEEEGELENEWRDFYWPIRGDVWPEEYGNSQRLRDASAKMRGTLAGTVPLFAPANFAFLG